eukprot:756247-Hanusia_phi.AAC.5
MTEEQGKAVYQRRMRDKPFRELQDLYDRGCLTYNEYLSELAMLKRQKIFAMKGKTRGRKDVCRFEEESSEIVEEEPFWMQFLPIRRITEEEIEMHAEHCRRIEAQGRGRAGGGGGAEAEEDEEAGEGKGWKMYHSCSCHGLDACVYIRLSGKSEREGRDKNEEGKRRRQEEEDGGKNGMVGNITMRLSEGR